MTQTWSRPDLTWTASNRASATLEGAWWSWAGPHGGLVASLALAAAEQTCPGQQVRELSAQFLAAPAEGPVELEVRPLRLGRSSTCLAVTLGSGDEVALAATVLLGRSRPGMAMQAVPAPAVPGVERCPEVDLPVALAAFLQNLDYRPATDTPLLGGHPSAEFIGWLRLRDHSPLDAQVLTVLLDALAPGLYATLTAPVPIPTVALSVQYAKPAPVRDSGWVLGRVTTRSAADGWCVDDSDLWGADGRLLASARQTRRVLDPAAGR